MKAAVRLIVVTEGSICAGRGNRNYPSLGMQCVVCNELEPEILKVRFNLRAQRVL